ncbi:MAG: hypothetical protein H6Q48_4609 [Deltaproteobacteria bacterium]|nr:hypothetical protein [Deltaproteobacteria bacterium]
MNGAWVPIDKAVIFSIPVFSHSASASFPFWDTAPLRAQLTLDFTVTESLKKGRELGPRQAFLTHLGLCSLVGKKYGRQQGGTQAQAA